MKYKKINLQKKFSFFMSPDVFFTITKSNRYSSSDPLVLQDQSSILIFIYPFTVYHDFII